MLSARFYWFSSSRSVPRPPDSFFFGGGVLLFVFFFSFVFFCFLAEGLFQDSQNIVSGIWKNICHSKRSFLSYSKGGSMKA